ncbi:hypothetical protein WH47_05267 [Habropoda laboriosa]|uniref:Uncharacterized protein n=1 Tax=Habropoda laboriosa TaxID=597456 RepID=A0A0L7QVH8_9HYME|nr:hypothetical protein WH47_05267 [Habropoda laboriosa]
MHIICISKERQQSNCGLNNREKTGGLFVSLRRRNENGELRFLRFFSPRARIHPFSFLSDKVTKGLIEVTLGQRSSGDAIQGGRSCRVLNINNNDYDTTATTVFGTTQSTTTIFFFVIGAARSRGDFRITGQD